MSVRGAHTARAACRLAGGFLALALVLAIVSCTPVVPNAWRLGDDGTVGFVKCTEFRASRLDVTYLREGIPVAEIAMEGEEQTLGGGHQLVGVPSRWLTSTSLVAIPDWDELRLVFSVAPFPWGTAQGTTRRDDPAALDRVVEVEVRRSQLRSAEWVWDDHGVGCDILPGVDGKPIYTGALSRENYELLLAAHPDLDSLADGLAESGRIAPILAFQTLILDEVAASALPGEEARDTLLRIRPTVAADALLAAELAVTRLGFTWDESAVRAGETD